MARLGSSALCFGLLVVVAVVVNVERCESAVILIGGDKGWTNKGVDYVAWAATQTVRVGDFVVFANKDLYLHTIEFLTSQDAYTNCAVGNGTPIPILPGTNFTKEVTSVFANQVFYVACSIPGHCQAGQKLAGSVLPALAPGAAPTAPPPGAMTAGPIAPVASPKASTSDADINRFICWTTAVLLIAACFWGPSLS